MRYILGLYPHSRQICDKKQHDANISPRRLSRYSDSENEYRHVQLPKNMLKAIPKDYFDASRGTLMLLWEEEWRGLGITQVRGPFSFALLRFGSAIEHMKLI